MLGLGLSLVYTKDFPSVPSARIAKAYLLMSSYPITICPWRPPLGKTKGLKIVAKPF